MTRSLTIRISMSLVVLGASSTLVAQRQAPRGFVQTRASAHDALEARFDAALEAEQLRDWMRQLTSRPHHVGSPFGKEVADFVAARFTEWGFDTAIEEFQVLFPTPRLRRLELVAPTRFTASLEEPTLPGDATSDQKDEQLPSYNAYSIDGDVSGELVYVNYGVPDDYEELARRGEDTMRYGPLKPIGLWDPRWGDVNDRELRREKRAYAVVQLRQEDRHGRLWNLVGFQTNLKWGEQQRILRMIPGLNQAEFVRFGVMHRNTFLESPQLLKSTLQCRQRSNLLAAGQITGTEGYAAAVAGGWLAGTNAARLAKGLPPISLPPTTMLGALTHFVSDPESSGRRKGEFQPMPANFGLLPELPQRIRNKRERYGAYRDRALQDLQTCQQLWTHGNDMLKQGAA